MMSCIKKVATSISTYHFRNKPRDFPTNFFRFTIYHGHIGRKKFNFHSSIEVIEKEKDRYALKH